MKHRNLTRLAAFLLAGATMIGFVSCTDKTTETETETQAVTETVTETTITTETETKIETETEIESESEVESEVDTEMDSDTETESQTETQAVTEMATEAETEIESEIETEIETELEVEPEIESEIESESEFDSETETEGEVMMQMSALSEMMQPIFGGNLVRNETVMFMEKGDVKSLLYPIGEIVSVTSYDCTRTYVEGVDYEVVNGQLKVLEGSSIPCITAEVYYNYPGSIIQVDGQDIFWGENAIQPYQVNVTYTHESTWTGYAQQSYSDLYASFIAKLEAGEDVTIVFYGDSITYGANASWLAGEEPNQYPYPVLFTHALADLFGYTVKHADYSYLTPSEGLTGAPVPPEEDYVAGDRGVITYINVSEGGENSNTGSYPNKMQSYLVDPITEHGCDLFVLAYGMNDNTSNINRNDERIYNKVWSVAPDAAVMLVSTMVPQPGSNVYREQYKQEDNLLNFIKPLQRKNKPIAVACMTSVSLSILETKTFSDYSGNNVNHPNDFFNRVYAQTLLQTLIGYENMR